MILGPYHFDATTAPHDLDSVVIGQAPAGYAIFNAFWRVTADIDDPLGLSGYDASLGQAPDTPSAFSGPNMSVPASIDSGANAISSTSRQPVVPTYVTKMPCNITLTYFANGGGPDPVLQGAADLYLIAAPWTP